MTSADWENPQTCNQSPEEIENIWNMLNLTWLTMYPHIQQIWQRF